MKKLLTILMLLSLAFTAVMAGWCNGEERIDLDMANSDWNDIDNYGIEKVTDTPTFTLDKGVSEGGIGIIPFTFFSDGMVLQRNAVNHVFGTSNYDGGVAVEIGDNIYYGVSANGRFDVYLPPVSEGEGLTMTVYGETNKVTVNDVCYGEVILFSGQSNMEWQMSFTIENSHTPPTPGKQFLSWFGVLQTPYVPTKQADPDTYYQYEYNKDLGDTYVKKAQNEIVLDDGIRFMLLSHGYSQFNIAINSEPRTNYDLARVWRKADTERAILDSSMFAYYFAKNLRAMTGVPVGVVVAALGSTATTAWVDRETYNENPSNFPNTGDDTNAFAVSRCYNTYIAPMLGYRVGSYVWYQGEGECASDTYNDAFSALVNSYRTKMDNPNMKVLVVSLPQYGSGANYPTGYTHDSYSKTSKGLGMENSTQTMGRVNQQKLPGIIDHCAVSVSVNTGDFDDIHPSDKIRISYQAVCSYLTGLYGFSDEAILYPEIDRVEKTGSEVKIYFKNLGKGLKLENNGIGFQISQNGRVYRQVKAVKSGDCIVIDGADVNFSEVNYIRYGYLQFPRISRIDPSEYVSVFNSYGMPLDQFELDVSNM